jgi:anti-sigma regulatory factor (Ser/Thr protein kinase)
MASFPLRSFLELGAYETAAGSARGHVRNVLAEWELGAFEEKAILIVSELVTNSAVATGKVRWAVKRPPVRLWLLAGPDGILVAVWDAVTSLPELREAGRLAGGAPGAEAPKASELKENGRGLLLVKHFSARWDYYRPPAPHSGKVIRSLITTPVIVLP